MSTETDTRDRVIRVEEQIKHLTQKFDDVADQQKDTNDKVTEMYEAFLKGQGVAWSGKLIWIGIIGILGALGLKITAIGQWLTGR